MTLQDMGTVQIRVVDYRCLIQDQVRFLQLKQMYKELPYDEFNAYLKVVFDGKEVKPYAE